MKTVYHIEIAKLGLGLSGGETSMLELIKSLSNNGYRNVLITTDNGKKTYNNLLNDDQVEYITINSYKSEVNFGALFSYIYRLKLINTVLKDLNVKDGDIIICHSEFFPNSITNWLITKKYVNTISACFYHMKAPALFKGYEGEFDGKNYVPSLRLINYKLNQWLYKVLTPKRSVIFTVNRIYKADLEKRYKYNKVAILDKFGGFVQNKVSLKKDIDILWLGRFHSQKGMLDIPKIMKIVTMTLPNVKLVIVGNGDKTIKDSLDLEIRNLGLEENIQFVGEKVNEQKYDYYRKSKVFIMTSHYESFGLVILEAMSFGLPVISYNLPVYSVFKSGLLKVKNGDLQTFSGEIVSLLTTNQRYSDYSNSAFAEAHNHSWEQTGRQFLENMI